ncbi:ATP-grasp domain-containing protein [Mesorhizobium sp. NBSH29]|uniref:acetyl/propionyl/methylcrotonyl-CoA carboxylase subunit alpha n=1 Tax=Mesorhizobium sp. NBSH29 TaxID=2654249 RepID=UPI0018964D83|nr:acetyl/propionyl/methylcrotonyl-CoA carboxylase subunit alpha [Mesorhizobium sp. NBSH29]QPC87251.1 ATP-grasp domain-containing protein [Mesorhizobium sp. NBSH29]
MFTKILIANRGEIAVRVMRTARRMGISTVAVYSDADAGALHVREADEAVHIGAAPVGESYLVADRIIEAALETGAEAVHPGYGFLSENPGFVDQVEAAGLVFIGPSSASIRAMGLKDAAKRLMEKAGVPVVPGYHGEDQGLVLLAGKAKEIGYPVLIKARAGGGGKGMRRVEDPEKFAEELASAKREAKAAFGDDAVLIEKYVDKPRHIEVQVFGDNHGNAVHLYERDCSAQRRHQKVIEEAPAPGMTPKMRAAMTLAAVKAAKAINYSGAGTIEFIVDASAGLVADRFWFMEMNTRLQVEHPVTEMVTGVDLVEWQLRVAAGEPLPLTQEEISLTGHAFEARIYAEDAARGFLPATGTLHHLEFPAQSPALRVETGVATGDAISPFYDPMIAKLVVHGVDRTSALDAFDEALDATRIAGSVTNIAFLAALARDPAFRTGDVDTGMIARRQEALVETPEPDPRTIALAALVASGAKARARDGNDPWDSVAAYAHYNALIRQVVVSFGDVQSGARVKGRADGRFDVTLEATNRSFTLHADDGAVVRWPGHVTVFGHGHAFTFEANDPLDAAREADVSAHGMRAPMPGLVKIVRVAAGDAVVKGQPLLVLEAMKMEHTIAAAQDGVVEEIVSEGAQVSDGMVLVRFAEADLPA